MTVLADLVILVHILFIVFVLVGGLLALRWRWAPLLHLPAVVWGAETCHRRKRRDVTGKNMRDGAERCVAR